MSQEELIELRQRLPRDRRTDSLTRAVDWSEAEARALLDYLDAMVNNDS